MVYIDVVIVIGNYSFPRVGCRGNPYIMIGKEKVDEFSIFGYKSSHPPLRELQIQIFLSLHSAMPSDWKETSVFGNLIV